MQDHVWPAKLDNDARCEVCGKKYSQWTADDPWCKGPKKSDSQ